MKSAKYIIRRFQAGHDTNSASMGLLYEVVEKQHATRGERSLEQIQNIDKDYLNLSSAKTRWSERDRDFFLPANSPLFLMDSELWMPRHRYHFFVASSRLKDLLVDFMGLPESSVRVFDRYKLFPARRPKFSVDQSSSFVLAQQAHPGKNLELTLAFLQALKRHRRFKTHRIYLCGPQRLDAATMAEGTKSKLFADVYDLGNLGTNWIKHPLFRTSTFVNLSTYVYEDFGVALAQAQAGGLPALVSDWFAHGDAAGSGALLLAFPEIRQSLKMKSFQAAGEILADSFLRTRARQDKPLKRSPRRFSKHTGISGEELKRLMSRLSSRDRLQLSVFFEPVILDAELRLRCAPDVVSILGGQR